ncbi:unnamed protein product [Mycena citricolor]|nr:unnamed protein product [Mycena citricolor]
MMKESAHTKLPQLVYRDPPPGVELHHYDIPKTEFRILFHKMIVPNTAAYAHFAFQWQFYVRSSTSQDLEHAPVVEMENPFNRRWQVITVFLAPPASALRINKQHVVRLPHDPALSVMPLNATLNE